MTLNELIKGLTTSKPNLEHSESIEGTSLIKGSRDGSIVIYDSKTNEILFGGPNPDLWYLGKLGETHIARKQDPIDENADSKYLKYLTYFVGEKGNLLFGGKYESEELMLADSKSEEYIPVSLSDFDHELINGVKGTEDVMIEFARKEWKCPDGNVLTRADEGILNIYNKSGRVLKSGIPACILDVEELFWKGNYEEIMHPATRFCFANVDGQLLFEVKYGKKSELYELEKS